MRNNADLVLSDFTVVVDTREKAPYAFTGFKAKGGRPLFVPTVRKTLKTADYSIVGCEHELGIEKKDLSDLLNCIGTDRARFEREHERMAECVRAGGFYMVLIEAGLTEAIEVLELERKLTAESLIGTAAAWQVRYRTPWVWAGGRRAAELVALKTIQSFWKERQSQ